MLEMNKRPFINAFSEYGEGCTILAAECSGGCKCACAAGCRVTQLNQE